MAESWITSTEAFHRLGIPYRKGLDWLLSGKLQGRRQGKNWEIAVGSVEALEREVLEVRQSAVELDRDRESPPNDE